MAIDVRNNGIKIGRVEIFKYNIKKLFLLGALGGTILVTVVGAGISKQKSKSNSSQESNAIVKEYDISVRPHYASQLDNTYTVDYEVGYGDTLYGLVIGYCEDANKANNIIDEIVRDKNNDLDNASSIRAGRTYTLYGVPEEHLADFGYYVPETEDLSNDERIHDSLDFIKSYIYNGRNEYKMHFDVETYGQPNVEFAEMVKSEIKGLVEAVKDYDLMPEGEEKEKAAQELIQLLDGAKTDIRLLTGDEFRQPAKPMDTMNKHL